MGSVSMKVSYGIKRMGLPETCCVVVEPHTSNYDASTCSNAVYGFTNVRAT